MRPIYRRSKDPGELDWHYKLEWPRWPKTNFVEADCLDPQRGDRISGIVQEHEHSRTEKR